MQFLLLIHYWYRAIVWTCKRYSTAHIIRYTWIAIVNIINNCVIYSYWEKNIFFLLSPLYQFVWPFSSKEIKKKISLSILILKITSFNNSACTLQLILAILKPADLRYSAWFWVYVKKDSFSRGWFRLLSNHLRESKSYSVLLTGSTYFWNIQHFQLLWKSGNCENRFILCAKNFFNTQKTTEK